MSIELTCECGREFEFADKFGGQAIKCPDCNRQVTVPAAAPRHVIDRAFEHDKYLISQKIRIDAKYQVTDEQGNPVLFVIRPTYLLRALGAIFGGMAAGGLVMAACLALAGGLGGNSPWLAVAVPLGGLLSMVTFIGTAMALSKKRHTDIYRDESGGTPFVTIEQDSKYQVIVHTYTVRDGDGKVMAKLRKNFLWNLIRKRWHMTDPNGGEILMAMEDSIWKAFLRRFIGPAFGLLRTNFVIYAPDSEDVIGEFNRKFTILDRYVLDLTADPERNLDRRLALAIGVMLDTGERR